MSTNHGFKPRLFRGLAIAAAGFSLVAGCGLAGAEERPSESQIVKALQAPSVARSLTGAPSPNDVKRQNLINGLRSASKTRSLSGEERDQLAAVVKERPSIDLEIYFDYNSAQITSRATPDLVSLGRALTDADLKGGVYLVAGHTDAKGSAEYNQQLSERRAQAVRDFLVRRFQIRDDTLVVAGYGKEQLKDTANPFAAQNRRVQITNLESKQETGN